MKAKLLPLIILLASFSGVHQASAQGTAFTYSGQLQYLGSPAPNGLYDFQFALSNAPSGGSQIGNTVTVTAVGVTNGLFTTTIDFGQVFSNSPTWLGISVRPAGVGNYTNLTPLQQLTPTPYAIYAESAGFATGLANGVAVGMGEGSAIDPSASDSFIGGGDGNSIGAGSLTVTIAGGSQNTAVGQYVTVGGGNANHATNDNATVSGGYDNVAGNGATVAGGGVNYAIGQNATVGGGYQNNASGYMATIGGGQGNNATDEYSTIGGGAANTASVQYGTVGGGVDNTALGYATVGGGQENNASFYNATVGGGVENTASGAEATVGGGQGNYATAGYAAVGGGQGNYATNNSATVPGGFNNVAGGLFSFAAGNSAQATNDGAFVWADDEGLPFYSTNNNSFNVRAIGGVRFVTGGAGIIIDGQPVLMGSGQSGATLTSLTINGALTLPSTSVSPDIIYSGSAALLYSDNNGNFFTGQNAGNTTTSGSDNTASGYEALFKNTSGDANTAYGVLALLNNSTGGGNTAVGNGALNSNTNGSENTASGDDALVFNTSGSFNVADGWAALYYNMNGAYNTADGVNALFNNTSGSNNIALGYNAGFNFNGNESSNIDIGNIGVAGDNNTIRIGTPGIQTQTFIAGVITNTSTQTLIAGVDMDMSANKNVNVTASLGDIKVNAATGNVQIQADENLSVTSGATMVLDSSANISLKASGTYSLSGALLEFSGPTTMNNMLQVSGLTQLSGGLIVTGNINASGLVFANGVQLTSDRNAKENFKAIDSQSVLAKVAALPVTEWNYKTDSKAVQHIGPMAQDFQTAFHLDGTDDKHISVVDEGGVALAAIQGLSQKLNDKDAEIQTLRQQNDSLAERLNELEATVKLLAVQK